MKFRPSRLSGAWLIELEAVADERGSFARTFCTREFAARGLESGFVQHSASRTLHKGTVRGMHFQREPHGEVKLVRCVRGSVYDIILDLRPQSPTYLEWEGFELSAENGRQVYIPKGIAHGVQSLSDDSELSYLISTEYAPHAASGYRHDEPAFAIEWPLPIAMIAAKDLAWPRFAEQQEAHR